MTKISALSDIGTSVASNDTFVLVDVSDPITPNKKIQQQNLLAAGGLLPDGWAGTPGLRFTSDTNVGLFRPTTDTLAFATGGSERLRIDSSGQVGLGTSSPTGSRFHSYASNAVVEAAIKGEITTSVFPGLSANIGGKFLAGGFNARYGVWGEVTNTGWGPQYGGFFKAAGTATNNGYGIYAETGSDNVNGFGIAYAGYFKATSAGTGTNAAIYGLRVENTAAVGGTSYGALISTVSGASTVIPFRVNHAGSTCFTIDSSGRVGVGTTSPSSALEVYATAPVLTVNSAAANASSIVFQQAGTTYGRFRFDGTNVDIGNLYVNGATILNAGGVERARIDSSGRLGVGSSSDPGGIGSRLWIDDTTNSYFTVNTTGSGSLSGIHFRNSNGNGEARFINNTGGAFTFYRNSSTEAARIDTSGRLLVGTSSSTNLAGLTANVQAESGANNGGLSAWCNIANTFGGYLALGKSRGTTAGSVTSVQSGDDLGIIYFFGADGTSRASWGAQIAAVVDGTPGTNDMPGRLVFSTTADGAAAPSERMRIDSSGYLRLAGAGIQFNGDTAAANALDDYEEGTWTVTDQSGAGLTLTTYSALYTKIGNRVYVSAQFSYPSTADTSTAKFSLPFTVVGGNTVFAATVASTTDYAIDVAASFAYASFIGLSTAPTNATLSGQMIYINGHYAA